MVLLLRRRFGGGTSGLREFKTVETNQANQLNLKNAVAFRCRRHEPMHNPRSHQASGINGFDVRSTRRTELLDITSRVQEIVSATGITSGVCHVYSPHTTSGIIINEGYDPDVARDIEMTLDKLVPRDRNFQHAEGNSDSHIKVALTATSQTIFIENGRLALGRWQAIFFCEFDGPRHRTVQLKIVSDPA